MSAPTGQPPPGSAASSSAWPVGRPGAVAVASRSPRQIRLLVGVREGEAQLAQASLDYCHQMALRSREGLAVMKQLARQGMEGSLSDGLRLEERLAVPVLLGDDVGEGLSAFEARRKPNFAA